MRWPRPCATLVATKEKRMSTISQDTARSRVPAGFVRREMWAALSIAVIWLAVLFAAALAPDIVASNAGANVTTIPSVVAVAAFAWPATWMVAKCGFGRSDND
jgi:hypothetical protein